MSLKYEPSSEPLQVRLTGHSLGGAAGALAAGITLLRVEV